MWQNNMSNDYKVVMEWDECNDSILWDYIHFNLFGFMENNMNYFKNNFVFKKIKRNTNFLLEEQEENIQDLSTKIYNIKYR